MVFVPKIRLSSLSDFRNKVKFWRKWVQNFWCSQSLFYFLFLFCQIPEDPAFCIGYKPSFFFFFIVCTRYYLQPENFSKNFHPLKKGIWYRAKQGKKIFFEFFSWFFRGFNTMVLSLKNKYFFGFSTGTNCKIVVYLI